MNDKVSIFLKQLIFIQSNILFKLPEADFGLLQHPAVNYYHKVLHLGYCSSPRSASGYCFLSFSFPCLWPVLNSKVDWCFW